MKRQGIILAVLMLMAISVNGQSVSPLFQVMASNPLVSRPAVFREMQQSINDELGKTTPGLHLSIFYEEMASVRRKLLSLIDTVHITAGADSLVFRMNTKDVAAAIKLVDASGNTKSPNDIFKESEIAIAQWVNGLMGSLNIQPSEKREAIYAALIIAFEQSGIVRDVSTVGFDSSAQSRLAKLLVGLFFNELKQFLFERHPAVERDFNLTDKKLLGMIPSSLDTVVDRLRQKAVEALDKAEHAVAEAVDDISEHFVAGNIGVGATEGAGAFLGGVYYSWVMPSFQLGVYVNGQFNNGDSTVPTQSLFGGRASFALDRLQLEVLYARLFGDEHFSNLEAGELGAGLFWRANEDFMLGLAYFNLHDGSFTQNELIGLTIRGTSPEAPGLLLGVEVEEENSHPIVQISFPLNPAK